MKYRRTENFRKAVKELPKPIQAKIQKAFSLFIENPQHPSLGVKKIKGVENIWEGRIDDFYRFTFEYQKDADTGEPICLFRNIGRHDIIDHAP
jgi:mRNA-degrading endonuclease RelE of RelBE toxin-antitoxin system